MQLYWLKPRQFVVLNSNYNFCDPTGDTLNTVLPYNKMRLILPNLVDLCQIPLCHLEMHHFSFVVWHYNHRITVNNHYPWALTLQVWKTVEPLPMTFYCTKFSSSMSGVSNWYSIGQQARSGVCGWKCWFSPGAEYLVARWGDKVSKNGDLRWGDSPQKLKCFC